MYKSIHIRIGYSYSKSNKYGNKSDTLALVMCGIDLLLSFVLILTYLLNFNVLLFLSWFYLLCRFNFAFRNSFLRAKLASQLLWKVFPILMILILNVIFPNGNWWENAEQFLECCTFFLHFPPDVKAKQVFRYSKFITIIIGNSIL